jgi:LysM repeat protein
MSEHSQIDTGVAENSTAQIAPKPVQTAKILTPEQKLASVSPPNASRIPSPTQSIAAAPRKLAAPLQTHSSGETIYVVKSGDTLTRIAKTHRTTIQALKSSNDLASDKIIVGQKLKIPTA